MCFQVLSQSFQIKLRTSFSQSGKSRCGTPEFSITFYFTTSFDWFYAVSLIFSQISSKSSNDMFVSRWQAPGFGALFFVLSHTSGNTYAHAALKHAKRTRNRPICIAGSDDASESFELLMSIISDMAYEWSWMATEMYISSYFRQSVWSFIDSMWKWWKMFQKVLFMKICFALWKKKSFMWRDKRRPLLFFSWGQGKEMERRKRAFWDRCP